MQEQSDAQDFSQKFLFRTGLEGKGRLLAARLDNQLDAVSRLLVRQCLERDSILSENIFQDYRNVCQVSEPLHSLLALQCGGDREGLFQKLTANEALVLRGIPGKCSLSEDEFGSLDRWCEEFCEPQPQFQPESEFQFQPQSAGVLEVATPTLATGTGTDPESSPDSLAIEPALGKPNNRVQRRHCPNCDETKEDKNWRKHTEGGVTSLWCNKCHVQFMRSKGKDGKLWKGGSKPSEKKRKKSSTESLEDSDHDGNYRSTCATPSDPAINAQRVRMRRNVPSQEACATKCQWHGCRLTFNRQTSSEVVVNGKPLIVCQGCRPLAEQASISGPGGDMLHDSNLSSQFEQGQSRHQQQGLSIQQEPPSADPSRVGHDQELLMDVFWHDFPDVDLDWDTHSPPPLIGGDVQTLGALAVGNVVLGNVLTPPRQFQPGSVFEDCPNMGHFS